ncbi:uncharacterized protein [Macrobrachium rosenbergii]|uniref:uncharacterized protein n=1 Tax=Macrobrachium rosenbergii TaxID=79674 RepID=UPI0034D3CC70
MRTHDDTKTNSWWHQWLAKRLIAVLVLVVIAGAIGYFFAFPSADYEVFQSPGFDEKLKEVCQSPALPMLEYRGVQSFFQYLTHPDSDYCYSWVEFGGEKIPIPSQSERECADEVRKSKYACFNDEYKMTHDPCLIYSFDKDYDNQFERDMDMFSCEVHAFDINKVKEAEHVQRTEFWKEHAWTIGEYPYDKPQDGGGVERRRSLDYITTALKHRNREIKLLKSDMEGREWILLRQIITHSQTIDIKQIAVRLHIPTSVNVMSGESRHEYFGKLFQVFQGLNCAGYKYVLGRPIRYYKGTLRIPEMTNRTFYPAYEVNWVKTSETPLNEQ